MQTVTEVHLDHRELEGSIQFYKQEISFLLKVLRPEYSKTSNIEKINMLDSYWRGFEKYHKKLESLLQEIRLRKYNRSRLLQIIPIHLLNTNPSESDMASEYESIKNELRTIKASFYDYLEA